MMRPLCGDMSHGMNVWWQAGAASRHGWQMEWKRMKSQASRRRPEMSSSRSVVTVHDSGGERAFPLYPRSVIDHKITGIE